MIKLVLYSVFEQIIKIPLTINRINITKQKTVENEGNKAIKTYNIFDFQIRREFVFIKFGFVIFFK